MVVNTSSLLLCIQPRATLRHPAHWKHHDVCVIVGCVVFLTFRRCSGLLGWPDWLPSPAIVPSTVQEVLSGSQIQSAQELGEMGDSQLVLLRRPLFRSIVCNRSIHISNRHITAPVLQGVLLPLALALRNLHRTTPGSCHSCHPPCLSSQPAPRVRCPTHLPERFRILRRAAISARVLKVSCTCHDLPATSSTP